MNIHIDSIEMKEEYERKRGRLGDREMTMEIMRNTRDIINMKFNLIVMIAFLSLIRFFPSSFISSINVD